MVATVDNVLLNDGKNVINNEDLYFSENLEIIKTMRVQCKELAETSQIVDKYHNALFVSTNNNFRAAVSVYKLRR